MTFWLGLGLAGSEGWSSSDWPQRGQRCPIMTMFDMLTTCLQTKHCLTIDDLMQLDRCSLVKINFLELVHCIRLNRPAFQPAVQVAHQFQDRPRLRLDSKSSEFGHEDALGIRLICLGLKFRGIAASDRCDD